MFCVCEEARDCFVGECLAPDEKDFAREFDVASFLLLPVGQPCVLPLMQRSPRTAGVAFICCERKRIGRLLEKIDVHLPEAVRIFPVKRSRAEFAAISAISRPRQITQRFDNFFTRLRACWNNPARFEPFAKPLRDLRRSGKCRCPNMGDARIHGMTRTISVRLLLILSGTRQVSETNNIGGVCVIVPG